ncbi:MAG: FHA domain-containing protein [Acidobacteriota bacterium]|nr:FHA domain-containing protein [Blastocatellia bacterium]MDW8239762.1 FHA domain-containing protein [Acidobacteriota bacterium]
MEQFLRRWVEKLGTRADALLGRSGSGATFDSLVPALYQAIESHLTADQHGVKRVFAGRLQVAFSEPLFSQLDEEMIESLRQELIETARCYVRDHRYQLGTKLVIEIVGDPSLREPFALRVAAPPSIQPAQQWWLQREDGRKSLLSLGQADAPRRVTLGRAGDNDIVVADPTVSRFHAALSLNPRGEILVSDLGSANGTFVNGQRVVETQALHLGDELTLGSVSFILIQE